VHLKLVPRDALAAAGVETGDLRPIGFGQDAADVSSAPGWSPSNLVTAWLK